MYSGGFLICIITRFCQKFFQFNSAYIIYLFLTILLLGQKDITSTNAIEGLLNLSIVDKLMIKSASWDILFRFLLFHCNCKFCFSIQFFDVLLLFKFNNYKTHIISCYFYFLRLCITLIWFSILMLLVFYCISFANYKAS